jgi:single-strand DNA-binding protein
MKSVNKVILVGLVEHAPEVKYIAGGIAVGRFSLWATNERFKDKTGTFRDPTEWYNIVVWRKLAEIVGEFVSKGSNLDIEGKLQTTSCEDRQRVESQCHHTPHTDQRFFPYSCHLGSTASRNYSILTRQSSQSAGTTFLKTVGVMTSE